MKNFFKKSYWVIIAFVIVVLDQLTKYIVVKNLDLLDEITVIPGFFSITHIHNEGIAFGMLSEFGAISKIIVAIMTLIMIVVAVLAIVFKWIHRPAGIVCISFIIGGGIGNLIDRVVLHYVIDFFAFTFWGRDFAIFNVADIFVTVGTMLFVVYFLFFEKSASSEKESADGNETL